MIGIYKITSPSGKVYIGQSININKRINSYKKLKCKKQPKLYNSLLKYGWEQHIFEVIEECLIEELNIRERYWQDFYDVLDKKKGLNCVLTKANDRSGRVSEETRLKRSGENNCWFGVKGEQHPLYNIPREEEVKNKISESQKGEKGFWYGKKLNKEAIQKRVDKIKGVKQKQEHIEKRRDTRRKNYILLNIQTGIYYYGYEEAANSIGMDRKILWQRITRDKNNKTNFILV